MFQIDKLDSFHNFTKQHPELSNKLIVARFKMDGCIHCINSKPKWDNLLKEITTSHSVQPHIMLLEIDSTVADNFIQNYNIVSEDNQPHSISGYPEHAFIENSVIYPSNSDIDTTLKSIHQKLIKHKGIKKTKVKKGGRRKKRNKRTQKN